MSMLSRRNRPSDMPRVEPQAVRSPDKGVFIDFATIEMITQTCRSAASGDLEARVIGLPSGHPLKAMADALNDALDRMDAFVRESAAVMEHCSQDRFYRPLLLQGLKGAFRQSAATINRAGSKMQVSHVQFQEISRLAEENAEAITTVASACEELNATTSEISRQASCSASSTRVSVDQVNDANSSVGQMAASVRTIEEIVTLIQSIADQTNLIALNAMIEASRAGQSGSRFAVVASEVKDLARNTSHATEKITQQVHRMREVAQSTETAFRAIHDSIEAIDQSAAEIQRTVTDQVSATMEVAHSIGEVAENTTEVSSRIRRLQAARSEE